MDRMVSWPLLPDEFTITTLFTIREEKNAKTQWAMSFRQGHASPEGRGVIPYMWHTETCRDQGILFGLRI